MITSVKYLFTAFLAFMTIRTTHSFQYTLISLLELFAIILCSEWICRKKRAVGVVVNDILCFFLNAQLLVLFFGNSFVQLVMLTNLESAEDLSGKGIEIITAIILMLIFSLLPIDRIGRLSPSHLLVCLSGDLILDIILVMNLGIAYSPTASFGQVAAQAYQLHQLKARVAQHGDSGAGDEFFADGVSDHRPKEEELPDSPNIILIFTEGLSQNIVEDDREIMPNLAALEEASLFFSDYYNHTFATYRALIGQLYSGYQLDDFDQNQLISLQQILDWNGYNTAFINTEPENSDFTAYLESFKFDTLINDGLPEHSGMADSYSDKEAYEILFNTASELSKSNIPFFVGIYTFGTHMSLDAVDEVYGDGSDPFLNKFYNLDIWLGDFLEKFEESPLAEDTIIVFTADHAAYCDADFTNAFPDYPRISQMIDEIPLCIYYSGMEAETISAKGRNTLDLAPTVLDYLDISEPNFFLGESLFAPEGTLYDTIFCEETSYAKTAEGVITGLDIEEQKEIAGQLVKYFSVSGDETTADIAAEDSRFGLLVEKSGDTLELTWNIAGDYTQIWFPVWSVENGQDDICWYVGTREEDGTWTASVDLNEHSTVGSVNVHVYSGSENPENLLCNTVYIPEF